MEAEMALRNSTIKMGLGWYKNSNSGKIMVFAWDIDKWRKWVRRWIVLQLETV